MSKSDHHSSFSFELSETPPPADAGRKEVFNELDLDLGDLGSPDLQGAEDSPQMPKLTFHSSASLSAPAAETVQLQSLAESPPAGISDKSDLVHEPQADPVPTGFLLDFEPLKTTHSQQQGEEFSLSFDSDSASELHPEKLGEGPSIEQESKAAQGGNIEGEVSLVAAPQIKKIEFPPRKKAASRGVTKPQTDEVARKQKTRFSKSISAEGVRDQLGSESELAPPEDLPIEEELLASQNAGAWGAEPMDAREIWLRARKKWSATSKHALALGGHGLRAGREMAKGANDRMRAKLQKNAEMSTPETGEVLLDLPELECGQAESSGLLPEKEIQGGSHTGRTILGLARTTGRKLAAPLSAVAAATLVYLGGTQLVGSAGVASLSKISHGPDIPELGTLEEEGVEPGGSAEEGPSKAGWGEKKEERVRDVGPADEGKSNKTPEMQAEITDMPEGLSWPGKGLIEVVTSEDELIYVDGVFTGRGPLRRIPVSPGDHEVSIRTGGKKRTGIVQVRAGRNTRAVFKAH